MNGLMDMWSRVHYRRQHWWARGRKYVWLGAAVTIAAACTSDPLSPRTRVLRASVPNEEVAVQPSCQAGCTEPDPHPGSIGVFLGSSVTPSACMTQTDGDQDGLGDFCEKNLAAAFAPELNYSHTDEMGREPHWVARPIREYPDTVLLGYLVSYYRDAGSQTFGCTLPEAPADCYGHNGDSEAIFLKVAYNSSLQHWVLNHAWYSQHTLYGQFGYSLNTGYAVGLEYASQPGGRPRTYVSEGKHANYGTRASCNGGGTWGSDDCRDVDTADNLAAGASMNLGSELHHTSNQDCMASSNPSNPYYGSGRVECYWSGTGFRGWIPTWVGGATSSPYSTRLEEFGF